MFSTMEKNRLRDREIFCSILHKTELLPIILDIQEILDLRLWSDIFPKKTYKWPIGT